MLARGVGKEILNSTEGKFKIRASVRNLFNQSKLEPLIQDYGEEMYNQIEFVEANLNNQESLIRAIQGVQYIIHVASPMPGLSDCVDEEMI